MDTNRFLDILRGHFENLPKDKSKIVRIFLSSTFSDFHTERDYLIACIYPKLKSYCKNEYGVDFQVFDMRWGISHEVNNTHSATTICLNEIKTCQKFSLGPNFIALLSHRYGARALPTRIVADEFELIRDEIINSKSADLKFSAVCKGNSIEMENVLHECYELDDNEVPARYRLKYLERIFPNLNLNEPELERTWQKLEDLLGFVLRLGARRCFEKELINRTQYQRYFVSVTEKEIFNGILKPKNVANNVLFFDRIIEDIEENIEKNVSLAAKFIELDKEKKRVDEEVRSLLQDLKYKKIAPKLPSSNKFQFKVKWNTNCGISQETHSEYIREFGEKFYEEVKKLIDKNQMENKSFSSLMEAERVLLQEVMDHAYFCNETVEKFHGRTDLIQKMKEYVSAENTSPLFIYGNSGCGKTALLAKLTSEIFKFVPDPHNYSVILRFLGTTPSSCDIIETLNSILLQISIIFGIKLRQTKFLKKSEIKEKLLELFLTLELTQPQKKLVLVLDSIDQLNVADYDLDWLLDSFPKNVRMLYSTLPNHGSILERIRSIKTLSETNFIEITSLNIDLAKEIIQDWLKKADKRISAEQSRVLIRVFEKAVLYPLYVKLMFDIVSKWTSFTRPDKMFEENLNIDKCIFYLFKQLESEHGKLLFSRAIIYMSSFRNGISENEIEDILSLDDEVLYDIFEFHAPPIRKLPMALWSRIKHSLSEYMVEKEVDDTRVVYWYHRRFIEVANSYYISKMNSETRAAVFANVVDFFNETWKNKPKPYKYNEYIASKKKLGTTDAKEVRETSIQPTLFLDKSGNMRFNKRKLNELPGFISQLTANLSLPLACEHVFFNYEFLLGMFSCCSLSEIMQNSDVLGQSSSYNLNVEANNASEELRLLRLLFLQCINNLVSFPNSMGLQLLSRSLLFYGELKYFTKLVDQYDKQSWLTCALVIPYQTMAPPTDDLIFAYEKHSKPISCAAIGGENDGFVFLLSDILTLYSMSAIIELGKIKLEKDQAPFTILIVYSPTMMSEDRLELKNREGGFVVLNQKQFISFSFSGSVLARKWFAEESIADAYLLSPRHLLVAFEHSHFFDIYDIVSSEFVLRKSFAEKVKFVKANTHKKYINNCAHFATQQIYLVAVLECSKIVVFKVTSKNEFKEISLEVLNEYAATGLECCSLKFNFDEPIKDYEFSASSFILTQSDGSVLNLSLDSASENLFFKPSLKNVQLKILHLKRPFRLFLGSNDHLYFWNVADLKAGEIKGSFDNGKVISEKLIAGFSKGIISFFMLKLFDEQQFYKYVKINQIDAHFDHITFSYIKDTMMLTTSRDTSMKVFLTSNTLDAKQEVLEFDRNEKDAVKIQALNESHAIAIMKNSNVVNIWNLSNGKIAQKLSIENCEEVLHCLFKDKLVVFSTCLNDNSYLTLRGFEFKEKNLDEAFLVRIEMGDKYRIVSDESDNEEIIVITEKCGQPVLNIYHFKVSALKSCCKSSLAPTNSIHFPTFSNRSDFILNNCCVTSKSKILVVNHDTQLIYVDLASKQTLFSQDLSNQSYSIKYFLSPTNVASNKLTSISSLPNTDHILALNNLNNLILISFNSSVNRTRIKVNESRIFESFKLGRSAALAYDKQSEKLVSYDFKCEEEQLLERKRLDVSLLECSLETYGLSADCNYAYAIVNRSILRFYRLQNSELIAEVPLYSSVLDMVCTREYIAMSMLDKKIISFLIVDPLVKNSSEKIKNLERRKMGCEDKKRKLLVKNILQKSQKYLESSDEEELDEDKIFAEIKPKNSQVKSANSDFPLSEADAASEKPADFFRKKITKRKLIKILKNKKLNNEEWLKMKENWLINLLRKDKLIGEEEEYVKQKVKKEDNQEEAAEVKYAEGEIEAFRKDLITTLTKSKNVFKIQNTRKNTAISNPLNPQSRSCLIQ